MPIVTSAEAQKNFGRYRQQALVDPVFVTQYGKPSVVIISAAEYERLKELDRRVSNGLGEGDPVDPQRPGDVLDPMLAEVLEEVGQPVAHVVVHRAGDEHAARIGECLDPRRDVDPLHRGRRPRRSRRRG